MLRMNNMQEGGWDLRDLKYVELPEAEERKYRLMSGDLLFNRTNSKELVGKCEVFREAGRYVFASYLIRVRLDESVVSPEFVASYLGTDAGRAQIDLVSRQIVGMANVNAVELKALEIPLPDLPTQAALVADMNAARSARLDTLAKADDLIRGIDDYLTDLLGLPPKREAARIAFAVRFSDLNIDRLDPPSYRHPPIPKAAGLRHLDSVAFINDPVPIDRPTDAASPVPYVGLPECDQTSVQRVVTRTYGDVRGRNVALQGDILFARIEPSVFNQKYVLANDLFGHLYSFVSTEFYVVRARSEEIVNEYLYAMFFSSFVFEQVEGKTTGSSGRRRLDRTVFNKLLIPVPDRSIQEKIADEVQRRRFEARRLRAEAANVWAAARARFEEALLGVVA